MPSDDKDTTAARAGAQRTEIVAVILAAAGESGVFLLAMSPQIAPVWPLLMHGLLCAGVAFVLFWKRDTNEDLSLAYLYLLLIVFGGPASALALIATMPWAMTLKADSDVTAAWYERLSQGGRRPPRAQTYDRIVSGRTQELGNEPPRNFPAVIENGTLEERQRTLGLIARHFHPAYTEVLNAALRSREPVVRVQAAAVVARVREDIKTTIGRLLNTGRVPSGVQRLAEAGEFHALASCMLIDVAARARCRDGMVNALAPVTRDALRLARDAEQAGHDAIDALEAFLMEEGRFRELRVIRRLFPILRHRERRVRRRARRVGGYVR